MDVVEQLWAASLQLRAGLESAEPLPDPEAAAEIEKPVVLAVLLHLAAASSMLAGRLAQAEKSAREAEMRWRAVLGGPLLQSVALAPLSHAFHMRLASRHGAFFRRVESSALAQWVASARLKSRFLRAMILQKSNERMRWRSRSPFPTNGAPRSPIASPGSRSWKSAPLIGQHDWASRMSPED